MVRQVWDLDEAEREYASFLAAFARPPSDDPLVRVTRLVHEWRRMILLDPALPERLLPEGWIGAPAGRLFRRQHARWLPSATREWTLISREAR
jgi:phenylacetic acid degradation operon negative regulatory protein